MITTRQKKTKWKHRYVRKSHRGRSVLESGFLRIVYGSALKKLYIEIIRCYEQSVNSLQTKFFDVPEKITLRWACGEEESIWNEARIFGIRRGTLDRETGLLVTTNRRKRGLVKYNLLT